MMERVNKAEADDTNVQTPVKNLNRDFLSKKMENVNIDNKENKGVREVVERKRGGEETTWGDLQPAGYIHQLFKKNLGWCV